VCECGSITVENLIGREGEMRNIFEGTAVTPKDREKILTNIITIVQEIDHDTGTNKNGVLDIIVQNSDLNSALLKMFVKKIYPGVEIV